MVFQLVVGNRHVGDMLCPFIMYGDLFYASVQVTIDYLCDIIIILYIQDIIESKVSLFSLRRPICHS